MICSDLWPPSHLFYFRGSGYGFGDDKSGLGGERRGSDLHDSDSDSELDIEGPGSPDPDEMNTSGDRDRSRDESGSEEDPLTKTSPVSSSLPYPGWPAHPAFSSLTGSAPPAAGHQPQPSPLSLNKITSQFWGFDPRPPLPTPPAHPLDSLSLSLPPYIKTLSACKSHQHHSRTHWEYSQLDKIIKLSSSAQY